MDEVPFQDRTVPKVEVDWDRSFWWWYPVTRAVSPAMRLLSLVLALIALLLIQAGLQIAAWLFQPTWSGSFLGNVNLDAPLSLQVIESGRGIAASFADATTLNIQQIAFVSFSVLWVTLVCSVCGGIIARRGAVELGQRTMSGWGEAFSIVSSRWLSFLWAVGMHVVAISLLLIPVVLAGLVGRLGSVGATISGVLLILCVPFAVFIGKSVVSVIAGFPLTVCAISIEKDADAFEGFSRANSYLFQRPVVAILCVIVLTLAGVVGEQLVFWTLSTGWWLVSRAYMTSSGITEGDYLSAGRWVTSALVASFVFSYFWTSAGAVYLILRKSVDHTELDEIPGIESSVEATLPEIPKTPPASPVSTEVAADSEPDTADEGPAA